MESIMKKLGSYDGAFIQTIIDRIDAELGYPNDSAATYSELFKRNGENYYFMVIQDEDVTTLLTEEEQAGCLDFDEEEETKPPAKAVKMSEVGYVVTIGDGTRLLGASSTQAFYYFKSLKGQAIWNYRFPIGNGQGAVIGNGYFAAVPPQSKKLIVDYDNGLEGIVVEDVDGIPTTYLTWE
jgi:hypothetical protein